MNFLGYLGPPGTFSHQAACNWIEHTRTGGVTNCISFKSIPGVLQAVEDDKVNEGIAPVENSIEGAVNMTLDCLRELTETTIRGEIIIAIRHCLLAKTRDLTALTKVYSHPQALAQCQSFLNKSLTHVETVETVSTAEAAAKVEEDSSEKVAAISSEIAAERYNLLILAKDIQDCEGNKTRFIVAGKGKTPITGKDKTSLVVFPPENRPGVLYTILREFARARINLSRIESRPTKKNLGEYLFFLDCEGHWEQDCLQDVISRLNEIATVQILGSYPRFVEER